MEQNYRITIFTTEGVIEGDFNKKELAIKTIMKFKESLKDFVIGILSEKIKGKWTNTCSIKK